MIIEVCLIEKLQGILDDPEKVKKIIQTDLEDIKDRYGDERRTQIVPQEGEIKLEDMIRVKSKL